MQALTEKGYDLNYTWGIGRHGQKQGGAILPDMMRWLWRDHAVSTDPATTRSSARSTSRRSRRDPAVPVAMMRGALVVGFVAWAAALVVAQQQGTKPAAPTAVPAAPAPSAANGFDTIVKPFLAANCYPCHGNDEHKRDLNFEAMSSATRCSISAIAGTT